MNMEKYMREMGARARQAAVEVAKSSTATRNQALLAIRDALKDGAGQLLEANAQDLTRGHAEGLEESLLDRLEVTPARLELMQESLTQVASLATPWAASPMSVQDPAASRSEKCGCPSGLSASSMKAGPMLRWKRPACA